MPQDPIDNTWARSGAIPNLAATAGTTDDTIADVTAVHDQTILNNNFRDLAAKVNAILAALRESEDIAGS